MKSIKNLVFLGMMGSGKTTVGSMVSKKLKVNFYDIDQEIEKKTKNSISEIFKKKGEKFFRQLEEKVTFENLQKENSIISLGGGAFTNKKIRNEVLKNHYSFWLNWNEKILIERIKNSKKRPLTINATDSDLIDLIKKRTNIYSKALYEIKCDNLTKNEIVDKIKEIYETN